MKSYFVLLITLHFVKSSVIDQEVAPGGLPNLQQTLDKYFESSDFSQLPEDRKRIVITELSQNIAARFKEISTKSRNHVNISKAVPVGHERAICEGNIVQQTRFTNASFGVGIDGQDLVADEANYPANCQEIMAQGHKISGIYTIKPGNSEKPFKVLCDMESHGGGWTHIQKRVDGRTNFNRGWTDYKFGFGYLDPGHEFWMGLEKMHLMTADTGSSELLVEIVDRNGERAFALYKNFAIGREEDSYPLSVLSEYSGDAGESLEWQLGMKFSTPDFDNDLYPENCAALYKSGWWFNACFSANLNGKFTNVDLPETYKHMGIHWAGFITLEYCHANARMLIRPTQY